MKETLIGAKVGCQFGHAVVDGIRSLGEDVANREVRIRRVERSRQSLAADSDNFTDEQLIARVDQLAQDRHNIEDATQENRAKLAAGRKALEACDVCFGIPENARPDFTCPVAMHMVKEQMSVVKVVTGEFGIRL